MAFWNTRAVAPTLLQGNNAFYISALLRGVVYSLTGIFTPIFVYKQVMSLYGLRNGLLAVAAYYALLRLTTLVSSIGIAKLIERIGFRHSIMLSLGLFVINQLLLAFAPWNSVMIILSAVVAGWIVPTYWIARHSVIAQDTDGKQIGKAVGALATLEAIASFLAPITGGVIILWWGYPALYVITAVILLLSIIPLTSMPHHTHNNGASLAGFGHFLTNRRFFHQVTGLVGLVGFDYGMYIIWPLLMYTLAVNTETVGWIFSLSAGIGILAKYLIGNIFDRLHNKGGYADEWVFVLALGGVVVGLIARIFVHDFNSIVILEIISSLIAIVYVQFASSYFALGGKRMGTIAYYVYGEMIYSITVIILMALFALGIYATMWREVVYMIAAGWLLTSVVLARESNMKIGFRG